MPRIAFFPDSFHEVNGVAHTARQFVSFARKRNLPMLCVCANSTPSHVATEGSVQTLTLDRGHWSVRLEEDLSFDPFFFRHTQSIVRALRAFKPDIVHITGPSELGLLGAALAHRLQIPLAASWHTNVHEYAGRRLATLAPGLSRWSSTVEAASLAIAARFYRTAQVLFAPHPTLCSMLARRTGRPCHLMQRGVDTALFTPARRDPLCDCSPRPLTLGYVGRLSVEKNVDLLPRIQSALRTRGMAARWVIVGQGKEERRLRRDLGSAAHFTGVLRGQTLANAFAQFDLLVFPSHTDTFGNVVLEALASGVPAIVTPDGGPASIVQDGITGSVVRDECFADAIIALASYPDRLQRAREHARAYALDCSWDAIFDSLLSAYPTR